MAIWQHKSSDKLLKQLKHKLSVRSVILILREEQTFDFIILSLSLSLSLSLPKRNKYHSLKLWQISSLDLWFGWMYAQKAYHSSWFSAQVKNQLLDKVCDFAANHSKTSDPFSQDMIYWMSDSNTLNENIIHFLYTNPECSVKLS